jgi:hypothetical protein
MTEATRTETTTEERSCRLCERPATPAYYFDEDEGLCPAHNRVRRAGDEVDDWEAAYNELTEHIARSWTLTTPAISSGLWSR